LRHQCWSSGFNRQGQIRRVHVRSGSRNHIFNACRDELGRGCNLIVPANHVCRRSGFQLLLFIWGKECGAVTICSRGMFRVQKTLRIIFKTQTAGSCLMHRKVLDQENAYHNSLGGTDVSKP